MRTIGQIICLLLLCILSACTSMEREILYQEYDGLSRAELHRKGKEGKWAVYNGLARKYDSDFIYDSYEALNLAEIDGSENYYVLTTNGEKHLYDARLGVYMLDGEPFEQITRDNGGFPMAKGKNRVYPMANNYGLPTGVDEYWRIGKKTFVYRQGSQYGVFQIQKQSKHNEFISLIAPTSNPLTVMGYATHDGAACFVIGEGKNRHLIDTEGLERTMRQNPGDYWTKDNRIWQLNTPPYDGESYEEQWAYYYDVTDSFFKLLDKIPIDGKERYYSQLKAHCTRYGNKQCSILICKTIELKYKWQQ